MTQTTPQQNGRDPAVEVARIGRSTQIWTGVIGACSGIIIAAIPAYFAGHVEGSKESAAEVAHKAPVTVTATATVTVTVAATATPSDSDGEPTDQTIPGDSGATSLFDLTPLRDETDFEATEAKINTRQYNQVLLGGVHCRAPEVTYQLDRKYKQFTATVGLTDDSLRLPVRFDVFIDDKRIKAGTVVHVGQTKKIKIPVSGAYRMRLFVADVAGDYCPAFEKSELLAAWIKPTLYP